MFRFILVRLFALAFTAMALVGCALMSGDEAGADGKPAMVDGQKSSAPVNLPFLLSMDFDEACAISKQHEAVPPHIRVAADQIEVLRRDAKGQPSKVRAKGHVFVQLDHDVHGGRALCQEALISHEDVILRGNPVLQRGLSTVEGVSDVTVFYLLGGNYLRAIGPHKLTNPDRVGAAAPAIAAWQTGPNPLLPPLDASVVPDAVRDEMRRAAEAEAVLQKSRAGMAPAFPNASPLSPVTEVKGKP